MAFPLVVAILLSLLFIGCVVVVTLLVVSYRGMLAGKRAAVREERSVLLARYAGAVAGVLAAIAVGSLPGHGLGPMLAPVAFGLLVLTGVIVGELVARKPISGSEREASLAPRRVIDYIPRAFGASLLLLFVGVVGLLAVTTLTASADDAGRAGRELTRACSRVMSASRSPYPGSYYSLPLLGGLVAAVVLAALAAQRAVSRPRGAHPSAGDGPLRRRSVAAVAGALGIAISAPAVGVGLVSGITLLGHDCGAVWFRPMGLLALTLALAAAGICLWSVFVLALSGTRSHAAAPTGPGVPAAVPASSDDASAS